MLLAGPERVMDLCQRFHLVSHINTSLQRHSLALRAHRQWWDGAPSPWPAHLTQQHRHTWPLPSCLVWPLAERRCDASPGFPSSSSARRACSEEHPLCLTRRRACLLLRARRASLSPSPSVNPHLLHLFLTGLLATCNPSWLIYFCSFMKPAGLLSEFNSR